MNITFLQIFLGTNIFIIGVVVTIAIQHAIAHFRPHPDETAEKHHTVAQTVKLPPEVREHLLQTAQTNFQKVLDRSSIELEKDLKTIVGQLNGRLEKLGTGIVNDEMKRYRMDLDVLRKQTEANISGAQTEITAHQTDLKSKIDQRRTELETKLAEDIAIEKKAIIQQIDTKLSDAVASFLTETLQHNIDLGSQTAYLMSMLEEHKAELIKGMGDET